MNLSQKLKSFFTKKLISKQTSKLSTEERLALLERNFLVLLKRVLEMDGIKLNPVSKANELSSKVMQTTNEENQIKATHDGGQTIH